MVRKVVQRILEELKDERFIRQWQEEKRYGDYWYSFRKNGWKEITGDDEISETDYRISRPD